MEMTYLSFFCGQIISKRDDTALHDLFLPVIFLLQIGIASIFLLNCRYGWKFWQNVVVDDYSFKVDVQRAIESENPIHEWTSALGVKSR